MAKREPVKASLRWAIFARDGFRCRYCGAQAGQDGVVLVCDHVVSVKEGGDSSADNLVTACSRCNGGKSARSLSDVPVAKEIAERAEYEAANLKQLSNSVKKSLKSHKEIETAIGDMKCECYRKQRVLLGPSEMTIAVRLLKEFGSENLREWYASAAARGINECKAIQYVCGCARNMRSRK